MPWTVAFPDAGIAPRPREALTSWDAEEDTRFYSGVATYETTVEVAAIPRGASVVLDFGAGKPLEPADKGPGMRTWLDAPIRPVHPYIRSRGILPVAGRTPSFDWNSVTAVRH